MVAFGKVDSPWWDDKPLAIVATGPSLKGFPFHLLASDKFRVLAVKASYKDLPFCDAVFGLDLPWMKREKDTLTRLARDKPLYVATPAEASFEIPLIENSIRLVRSRTQSRMSDDPCVIESGGNSGFGALNLAYLKRAKDIVLFGFDYTGNNYCPENYVHRTHSQKEHLLRWSKNFKHATEQLAQSMTRVQNASEISIVDAFPKTTAMDGLIYLHGV